MQALEKGRLWKDHSEQLITCGEEKATIVSQWNCSDNCETRGEEKATIVSGTDTCHRPRLSVAMIGLVLVHFFKTVTVVI